MCNLYRPTPKNDVEVFVRRMVNTGLRLADHEVAKPVGPFGTGPFIRAEGTELCGHVGQWGLIRPGQRERIDWVVGKAAPGRKPPAPKARSTNNARIEGIEAKPTFREAWARGQRCLVPANWYAEPNWETGQCVWWHLKRADGLPWMLAGLWSEWTDPHSGEIVPNFTMITCNCDTHPLLNRLHKPDPKMPAGAQDKRSLIHLEPADWAQWLQGAEADARALIRPAAATMFDLADATRTDVLLAGGGATGRLF